MRVTLYIPGLLDRLDQLSGRTSGLQALLAHKDDIRCEREGAMALLAPIFGIARQQDWPLAPLRARALGLDAARGYWLRAWPVHLEAGQRDVRVQDAVGDLDEEDADALLQGLSRHFQEDALVFSRGTPGEWFLTTASPPRLITHPLTRVLGQPLRPFLPHGEDAAPWRRWLQESEMLLHAHPINEARENAGRTTANALWLEYGGVLPQVAPQATRVRTDHADVQALARAAGAHESADREDALRDRTVADVVITTAPPAPIEAIESDASAVLRVLNSGQAERALVIVDGRGAPALAWEARRASWLRRLRPAKVSLAEALAGVLDT